MSNTVPDNWNVLPLGSVIKQVIDFRGRTPKKLGMEWGGGNIRALSANNVQMGRVDFNKECYLASDELYDKWMTKGTTEVGDILFTMEAPLGNIALVPNDDRYILSQRVILLKNDKSKASSDFLFQQLRSDSFQDTLRENATGTTAQGIQQKRLVTLDVVLPPLPEQQKIAKILTSVDEVIEKTQAQIDKLKDLKTGMMQELLTQGVGIDGKPHTEFKDSPVGLIPKAWNCVTLKNLSKRITDGTHQTVKTSPDGTIPFLYVSCVRDGNIDWEKASFLTEEMYELASKGRKPENGDILYTAVGSYGHAAIVSGDNRFSFQRHIAFIQPNHEKIDSEFLVSFLNSPLGKKQADLYAIGNAQLTVTLGDLGKFKVALPDIAEQQRIAKIFNGIDNRIIVVQRKLTSLGNTKKALMQDLLTGKVRVAID